MTALTPERRRGVWIRDGWQCRMPVCLHPGGRAIDPELAGLAGVAWAPSVDHIVQVADGGTNAWANLRSAHYACNDAAAAPRAGPLAARIGAAAVEALLALRGTL